LEASELIIERDERRSKIAPSKVASKSGGPRNIGAGVALIALFLAGFVYWFSQSENGEQQSPSISAGTNVQIAQEKPEQAQRTPKKASVKKDKPQKETQQVETKPKPESKIVASSAEKESKISETPVS